MFEVVFWSILAYAFVGGVVALVIFVLYELSPFAHHGNIEQSVR